MTLRRGQRSTVAGEHRPVLLEAVLRSLDPQTGQVIVDCTVGWAGHAVELLRRIGKTGNLIALDLDQENLLRAKERLETVGYPFAMHHGNFAGLQTILAAEGVEKVDALIADLGMSSMQVDDPERGFSYVRDGPLDMRMDRTRGRTGAQLLASISEKDLRQALETFGDEPEAKRIAAAIVATRRREPIQRTGHLARLILETIQPGLWSAQDAVAAGPALRRSERAQRWRLHPAPNRWNSHPAARTFQALRILINRELANLDQLLRVLPTCLAPGGKAAIISFHSGEDRLVKTAFRTGLRNGMYSSISQEPISASWEERADNPRARSAKMRWAQRTI
jgi:16S rRNA (cytosine1402-N4)-methyltransferase